MSSIRSDIDISVSTPEDAARLQEDFEELIARVNGDLLSYTMKPDNPISIEAAMTYAEQQINFHASTFADDAALQKILPEIKKRFRVSIEEQARDSLGG